MAFQSGDTIALPHETYIEGLAVGEKRPYHGIVDRSEPGSPLQDLLLQVVQVEKYEYVFQVVELW
ncbi:hypothetical protein ACUN9Y_13295 [Halomonas sp. V046]|uniref:hypothetical protein n=1 Tax=Halomonas sp. V046 TaxID=3459611 RepID=UPI004044C153